MSDTNSFSATRSLLAARMAEGASNCVERHLNLNGRDTSLIWTYSQVGHKCCFHNQSTTGTVDWRSGNIPDLSPG